MNRGARWAVRSACVVALISPALAIAPDADGKGACGPGMVLVASTAPKAPKPFCIDRYEGSLVEVTDHGEKPFSPFASVSGAKVRAVSRANVVPQAYVSRNEADVACRASGKRLCAEDEWETACEGRTPTTFPYGDDRKDGYCNDSGVAPLAVVFPNMGDAAYGYETMNDPRLNQVPGSIAKTGSHPHCRNSFGVFDMVGNVHEWVEDPAGTFRGGYYLDTHINGDGCHYKTVAHDASYHDYSTGFRCCSSRGK